MSETDKTKGAETAGADPASAATPSAGAPSAAGTDDLGKRIDGKVRNTLSRAVDKEFTKIDERIDPPLLKRVTPWAGGALAASLLIGAIDLIGGPEVSRESADRRVENVRSQAEETIRGLRQTITQLQARPAQLMAPFIRGRDVMLEVNPNVEGENNQVLTGPMQWVKVLRSNPVIEAELSDAAKISQAPVRLRRPVAVDGTNDYLQENADGSFSISNKRFYIPETIIHSEMRQSFVAQGLEFALADSERPAVQNTNITYRFKLEAAVAAQNGNPATPEKVVVIRDIDSDGTAASGAGDMENIQTYEVR